MKHYLPLFGILGAGVFGFILFSYDQDFQIAIVISSATGYIAWGVVHHSLHEDLHLGVLLEYIALAVLGVVIITSLILRV